MLLTGGVAGAGIALADRRRSVWAILGVLGSAQLAAHVLLSIHMTAMVGMQDEGLRFNGLTMLLAHAVAVTALILFHADEAMFFAASACARLVPAILLRPLPAPSAAPRVRPHCGGGDRDTHEREFAMKPPIPHEGFSTARRRMSRRIEATVCGRPGSRFVLERAWRLLTRSRCHRSTVSD